MKIEDTIELTCTKEEANSLLSESIDWPLHSVWFGKNKFKGRIKKDNFIIWPKTKFVRGWPVAIAKGSISALVETMIKASLPDSLYL